MTAVPRFQPPDVASPAVDDLPRWARRVVRERSETARLVALQRERAEQRQLDAELERSLNPTVTDLLDRIATELARVATALEKLLEDRS